MSMQRQLCDAIKTILDGVETLADAGDADVIVEDRVDPATAVRLNAKTKLRVLIATTGHAHGADAGPSTSGDTALEITVFEDPARRRARPDALTVTGASDAIVTALHWRDAAGSRLRYVDMARADADEHDYRMVITFAAEQAPAGDRLAWGLSDGAQAYGVITKKATARGGTPIFETGRDGRARFTGVRDPHLTVDLSANVTADADEFPEIGDAFTCPIEGVETAFLCTLSALQESTENGKTIHLAGRTVGQQ